jgi:hypothetical protein
MNISPKTQKILMQAVGSVVALVVLVMLTMKFLERNSDRYRADVEEMCNTPLGSPVDDVISQARSLGFTQERDGVLGQGLTVVADGRTLHRWKDDTLAGYLSGEITVGKIVTPPFGRLYCRIRFDGRRVVETQKLTGD